jgi:hypothetical protein
MIGGEELTTMLRDPFTYWLEQGRRSITDPAPRTFMPPTDLLSGERDVKVVMDVPGLTVDDIEIELTDGTLAIRGERRYPYREHEDSHELNPPARLSRRPHPLDPPFGLAAALPDRGQGAEAGGDRDGRRRTDGRRRGAEARARGGRRLTE